jgi:hypothetical protein
MIPETMTKIERLELGKVARMNAAVAKHDLEARGQKQLADVEVQLARIYKANHEAFAHLTQKAKAYVDKANADLAAICRKMKVPATFAPKLDLEWYGRGENADKARRAELRKAAEAQVTAAVASGKVEIDRQTAVICTNLCADGLTTEKARGFLALMPSAEKLLPQLSLPQLEQTVDREDEDEERLLGE